MKQLSADAKHHILLEYALHDATRSFAALAVRHNIKGGREVIRQGHERWDGTAASLQHRGGAGRPRALDAATVTQYVRAPLRRSNRAHRTIHYSSIASKVREATGINVSDRTVRRIGKEELGAKKKRGNKRTAQECEYNTHTCTDLPCMIYGDDD
jgi:hypothetical protein